MIKVNKYLTNKVIARGVISDWLTRSLAAAWTNESARIKADRFFWTEPGIFLRIKKKKKNWSIDLFREEKLLFRLENILETFSSSPLPPFDTYSYRWIRLEEYKLCPSATAEYLLMPPHQLTTRRVKATGEIKWIMYPFQPAA